MKLVSAMTAALILLAAGNAVASLVQFEDETQFLFHLWGQDLNWVSFDTFPDGSTVPTGTMLAGDEWASLGVTFSSPGNTLMTAATGIGTASSPPNYLSIMSGSVRGTNSVGSYDLAGGSGLTMDFGPPALALGFTLLGPDFGLQVVFKDADGQVLLTLNTPSLGDLTPDLDPSFFVGVVSDTPVSAVEILQPPGAPGGPQVQFLQEPYPYGIDDVILQPIPEPATLLILGLGAAGIAWRRRRRK